MSWPSWATTSTAWPRRSRRRSTRSNPSTANWSSGWPSARRTGQRQGKRRSTQAGRRAPSSSNMSHEIRTPMNAILGLTHLLRTRATAGQAERLGKIDAAGKHLLSIINDILDISKIEAGKLQLGTQRFHPAGRARPCPLHSRPKAPAPRGWISAIDTATVPAGCAAMSLRLRQAVLNYAGNALKFTQQGPHHPGCPAARRTHGDELHMRFSVSDTGVGIDAERLPQLFEAVRAGRCIDHAPVRRHRAWPVRSPGAWPN